MSIDKPSKKDLQRVRDDSLVYTGSTRMPFGKYKGEPLMSIPDSYLYWVLCECMVDQGFIDYLESRLEDYDPRENDDNDEFYRELAKDKL